MKQKYKRISLAKICGWFGVTRQAYYQHSWQMIDHSIESELVIKEVVRIRNNHPRMGGRKLYFKLGGFLQDHQIKMGRDSFFDLLSVHNLLVRRRKRKVHTTMSFHWLRKYPNLIKDYIPQTPNRLWVSDITYWKVAGSFVYVSLITDAYSHMIVGWQLAQTLESIQTLHALKMALMAFEVKPNELIHHSDRGVQYCSKNYVALLNANHCQISMTQSGDPLENALAERVNGILKEEYLLSYEVTTIEQAKKLLDRTIKLYNTDRPHMSISNMTPAYVHYQQNTEQPERLWKNYYKNKQHDTV